MAGRKDRHDRRVRGARARPRRAFPLAGQPPAIAGRGARVKTEGPAIEHISAAVYVIPTDAPEADGTLVWTKTTLILVAVTAGGMQGIGWTYGAAAAGSVVADVLADTVIGRSAIGLPRFGERCV